MRALLLVVVGCSNEDNKARPPDGGPWACPANPPRGADGCSPPLACEYADPTPCARYFVCVGVNEFDFHWEMRTTDCTVIPSCTSFALAIEAGAHCAIGGCNDNDGGRCGCRLCKFDPSNGFEEWMCVGGLWVEAAGILCAQPPCP